VEEICVSNRSSHGETRSPKLGSHFRNIVVDQELHSKRVTHAHYSVSTNETMRLCMACQAIRVERLPDTSETGFRHSTAASLLISAKKCPQCSLMKTSFLKVDSYIQPADLVERHLSSYGDLSIRLFAIRRDRRRTVTGGANLIAVQVEVVEKRFRGRFDICAEPSKL
jgi:hypothetical protein